MFFKKVIGRLGFGGSFVQVELEDGKRQLDSQYHEYENSHEQLLEDHANRIASRESLLPEVRQSMERYVFSRQQEESYKEWLRKGNSHYLTRPISEDFHHGFLVLFVIAELTAGYMVFRSGFETLETREMLLLPLGLVTALVVCAHNLGTFLRGIHTAQAVAKMSQEEKDGLPPAEFFGHTPIWNMLAMASGIALALVASAVYMIRSSGSNTEQLPPGAFVMLMLALAVAAVGEQFLFTNLWIGALNDIQDLVQEDQTDYLESKEELAEAEAEIAALRSRMELLSAQAKANFLFAGLAYSKIMSEEGTSWPEPLRDLALVYEQTVAERLTTPDYIDLVPEEVSEPNASAA